MSADMASLYRAAKSACRSTKTERRMWELDHSYEDDKNELFKAACDAPPIADYILAVEKGETQDAPDQREQPHVERVIRLPDDARRARCRLLALVMGILEHRVEYRHLRIARPRLGDVLLDPWAKSSKSSAGFTLRLS
ncbi:MAG: hypothetical protein ABIR79_24025 [Candidatus Binatia bacterium]